MQQANDLFLEQPFWPSTGFSLIGYARRTSEPLIRMTERPRHSLSPVGTNSVYPLPFYLPGTGNSCFYISGCFVMATFAISRLKNQAGCNRGVGALLVRFDGFSSEEGQRTANPNPCPAGQELAYMRYLRGNAPGRWPAVSWERKRDRIFLAAFTSQKRNFRSHAASIRRFGADNV